ncbi:MAG: recombinase family protein [Sneathiella sp.]
MIAAISCRTSVDGNVSPIAEQISKCEKFCKERGYIVVGKYLDETIANVPVFQRPGMTLLIDSLIVNNVYLVVTEHASVISEETTYLDGFYSRLAFLNATLETIKPNSFAPLSDAPPMTMKYLKSRKLENDFRKRIIAAAMQGEIPGGKIYGYKPEKGFRIINREEADVVTTIYEMAANQQSAGDICDSLNAQNIRPPQSSRWNPPSLLGAKSRRSGILRQTLYSGVFTFNKTTFKKHPDTGKRQLIVRPIEDWIQIPLPELGFIEPDLFKKVQDVLDIKEKQKHAVRKNRKVMNKDTERVYNQLAVKQSMLKKGRPSKGQKSIYSRNLICGECGSKLAAERVVYYSCKDKACSNRKIKKEVLSQAIYEKLVSLSAADFFEGYQLHLKHADELNRQRMNISKDLSRLEILLKEQGADIDMNGALNEQIQSLRLEINKVSSKIDELSIIPDMEENLETIYKNFIDQTTRCMKDPDLSVEIEQIRHCVENIIAKQLGPSQLDITLSFNFAAILFLFR